MDPIRVLLSQSSFWDKANISDRVDSDLWKFVQSVNATPHVFLNHKCNWIFLNYHKTDEIDNSYVFEPSPTPTHLRGYPYLFCKNDEYGYKTPLISNLKKMLTLFYLKIGIKLWWKMYYVLEKRYTFKINLNSPPLNKRDFRIIKSSHRDPPPPPFLKIKIGIQLRLSIWIHAWG